MAPRRNPSGGSGGGGGAKTYIALAIGLMVGAGVALMNSKRDHSPYHSTTEYHIPSYGSGQSVSFPLSSHQSPEACKCEAAQTQESAHAVAAASSDPLGRHAGHGGEVDSDLLQLLRKIAVNGEVMAAVSNKALITPDGGYGMLKTWVDGCKRIGMKNYMVIAMDEHTYNAMKATNVPVWLAQRKKMRDMDQSNHGISGQKFHLLKNFLLAGYNVLLSDVDIVTLQNPFDHLYRDADVEGLSDGYDPKTAYGWMDVIDDPGMGWARYVHTVHWYVMNSGLFFIKANEKTVDLMDRITARLEKEKAWDQAVFNEEIFYPSHDEYKASTIVARIMNIHKFMNSKTLFKYYRKDWRLKDKKPVMVHVNYHPDKWPRMQAIEKKWVDGISGALDHFPVGSGRKRAAVRRRRVSLKK
mmetsp:Transcript_22664/g.70384  ORF Transcript_22664/g.70384 Transcript_22664/m.70384 type:complete len:412 (+) Transcript_22664:55-1290(+)